MLLTSEIDWWWSFLIGFVWTSCACSFLWVVFESNLVFCVACEWVYHCTAHSVSGKHCDVWVARVFLCARTHSACALSLNGRKLSELFLFLFSLYLSLIIIVFFFILCHCVFIFSFFFLSLSLGLYRLLQTGLFALLLHHFPSVYSSDRRLFFLAMAVCFAHMSCRLIVDQMTAQRFSPFPSMVLLLPIAIAIVSHI